jgi:hypothetical protein
LYAIFCCQVDKENRPISGQIPHVYWFMNKDVKKGDIIVLYSKSGRRSEKNNDGGYTSHFFYWGRSGPIWTKGRIPVLVETPEWTIDEPIQ